MRVVVSAVAVLATGFGGCATLDRGTTDKFYVISDPPGAKAILSTGLTCTTPCDLDVSRLDEFSVSIAKAGYEPQRVEVKTRLTASGVGDLMENVTTGGLGMVVDTATGATLEHVPDPVSVTLKPNAISRPAKKTRSPAS